MYLYIALTVQFDLFSKPSNSEICGFISVTLSQDKLNLETIIKLNYGTNFKLQALSNSQRTSTKLDHQFMTKILQVVLSQKNSSPLIVDNISRKFLYENNGSIRLADGKIDFNVIKCIILYTYVYIFMCVYM